MRVESASKLERSTLDAQGPLGLGQSVAFSPDGKLVVLGSHDNTVRVWDVVTGAELQTLKGHLGPVWSVAFSPDGNGHGDPVHQSSANSLRHSASSDLIVCIAKSPPSVYGSP